MINPLLTNSLPYHNRAKRCRSQLTLTTSSLLYSSGMAWLILIDLSSISPVNMLSFILGALWVWGFVFPMPGVAAEAPPSQQPATLPSELESHTFLEQLVKRQTNDTSSICKAYGVDYQDGGSYFVDQKSNAPFRAVTKFEG